MNELNKLSNIINLQAQNNEALAIFRNTYGRVKQFREHIASLNSYFNDRAKFCDDAPNIKNGFFSDLIISYLSLSQNDKDFIVCRLNYMLISLSDVFLNMLAKGIALRGGVDICLGIESHNGQNYMAMHFQKLIV